MSGRAGRLVALVAIAVLALAVAVSLLRGDDGGSPSPSPSASTTEAGSHPSPSAEPSEATTPDAEEAQRLLGTVEAAASAEPADLLQAGVTVGRGPWRTLSSPAWPMRGERPVYVGRVSVEEETVAADLVIAHRVAEPTEELVLRLLPAAVGDNGLQVTASVGGAAVAAEPDPGGLLRVELPEVYAAGEPLAVRVELSYDVLAVAAAPDDSGPAAYGILAASPGVVSLGHWLPVLTFEPQPIVPWGDLGSFPAAVWSLQVEHDGMVVTGGSEDPCPGGDGARTCTWSRGLALREVAAVVFDEAVAVDGVAAGMRVRSIGRPEIGEQALETAVQEAVSSAEGFTARFGPVAWRELDVVAAPLGRGAAGMEFPGLVLVDDELYGALDGAFGSYVLVHEVAHQWFHALVGHGSFSDPVVDEPLAQYLSVLAYRDLFGSLAAEALVEESMAGRYRRFRESGSAEEPPSQPTADFEGPGTYGPLLYARAPLGWLAAEDLLGEDVVVRFLAQLVDAYGLGVLSAEELLDEAAMVSPELAEVLERYWYSEEPVPIP